MAGKPVGVGEKRGCRQPGPGASSHYTHTPDLEDLLRGPLPAAAHGPVLHLHWFHLQRVLQPRSTAISLAGARGSHGQPVRAGGEPRPAPYCSPEAPGPLTASSPLLSQRCLPGPAPAACPGPQRHLCLPGTLPIRHRPCESWPSVRVVRVGGWVSPLSAPDLRAQTWQAHTAALEKQRSGVPG